MVYDFKKSFSSSNSHHWSVGVGVGVLGLHYLLTRSSLHWVQEKQAGCQKVWWPPNRVAITANGLGEEEEEEVEMSFSQPAQQLVLLSLAISIAWPKSRAMSLRAQIKSWKAV